MIPARSALVVLVLGLIAVSPEPPPGGRLSVLTYNVAGLPQGISQSQPLFFMPLISPRLNAFDLVLAQEDFFYGRQLRSKAEHPYYSPRSREGTLGDGLSRFSRLPMSEVEHVPWVTCYGTLGHANDCLTPKGFAMGRHEVAPGVTIDVYDLHMDAGGSEGDREARRAGMKQLIEYMAEHSAGHAMIVAGDFNISPKRPDDMATLQALLDDQGLADARVVLNGGRDRIDRVLFRGSACLRLEPLEYQVESERFTSPLGLPLSDHKPVSVTFAWQALCP
jgi:endonuclease/exonuclease/phosphatase family metal-dependent hydrolase